MLRLEEVPVEPLPRLRGVTAHEFTVGLSLYRSSLQLGGRGRAPATVRLRAVASKRGVPFGAARGAPFRLVSRHNTATYAAEEAEKRKQRREREKRRRAAQKVAAARAAGAGERASA